MASTNPAHDGSDQEVLGSLPSTRPQRRSAKRDAPSRTRSKPTATAAAAKPEAAQLRPKRAAKPRSKLPAEARSRATPPPPPVPPAGYATPSSGPPVGADLVVTAVVAAGELLRVGLVAWAQAVRSAVRHLPRP